jgi:tetratricopeptide (TPR) repeat protein
VARLTHFLGRRRLLLILLLLTGCAVAFSARHLWAWYHWRAAQAEEARFHNAQARAHLDACLAVWPGSAPVHLLAARTARRAGAFEEAAQHLKKCEDLDPARADDVALEWALLHAVGGDLSETVEKVLLVRTEKEPAQAPLILEALAEGYTQQYRIRAASACVERWLTLQPDNVQALFLRGNISRKTTGLEKAVPDYRRVVELDAERDDARWWLALGLLQSGHYAEALEHLEHLRGRGQDDPELPVRLALCRKGLDQLDAARQDLDTVLAGHPGYPPALRAQGEVELAAGRPERAEPALRQAVAALPHDYQAQFFLWQSLRQQGRQEEARVQKKTVDELKDRTERLGELRLRGMAERPRDPALHYEMGTLLLNLGQAEDGEAALLRALSLAPDYAPAHAALAEFYRQRGDATRAAWHRQRAPSNPGTASAPGVAD